MNETRSVDDPQIPIAAAFREGRVIQVEDLQDPASFGGGRPARRHDLLEGMRTALWVPMRRAGESIGVIVLFRSEKRLFAPEEIELLSTFADQAVIAIDNARDRKSTRLNSSHSQQSRMPSSA